MDIGTSVFWTPYKKCVCWGMFPLSLICHLEVSTPKADFLVPCPVVNPFLLLTELNFLCVWEPCASAETEPSLNLQRQYLTSLSKWYPSHLSWCLNQLKEQAWDAVLPPKAWGHICWGVGPGREYFLFWLYLFIYSFAFGCSLRRYYLELWQPLCNYEGTNHPRIKLTWRYFLIYPRPLLLGEVTSIYYSSPI